VARGVKRFTELRAWQACDVYKKAIYLLCDRDQIARDCGRRKQLEESASRPTAHIAEGFGRFNPPDFAQRQARNIERRAPKEEPRTPNKEPRTELETEGELRSENSEG
jgi:hypothetical protein